MQDHCIVRFEHRICWAESFHGFRIIALDTVIPEKHHGGVGKKMLEWLA